MSKYNYQTVGAKYEEVENMDIKDIAKLVRKDIKEAFPNTNYKFSVRIERFSMGRSLKVYVNNTGLMPRSVQASTIESKIQEIVDQYNFDDSDWLSDYSHVNFYSSVRLES